MSSSGGDALFPSYLLARQAAHCKLGWSESPTMWVSTSLAPLYMLTTWSVELFTCLKLSTCLRPDGPSLPIWGPGRCLGQHRSWTLWIVHCSANWWCSTLLSRPLPWSKYPCFPGYSCLQSPQTVYSVTHSFQCSTWSTPWIGFPRTCSDPSPRDHSLPANPYHKTVPMIRM